MKYLFGGSPLYLFKWSESILLCNDIKFKLTYIKINRLATNYVNKNNRVNLYFIFLNKIIPRKKLNFYNKKIK